MKHFLKIFLLGACLHSFIHSAQNIPQISSPASSKIIDTKYFDQTLRGNGVVFIQNKGQIVDMNEQQRPDILFKSDGAGSTVYLRKTGLSYVLSNLSEIMEQSEEHKENLKDEIGNNISGSNERLIDDVIIKTHRIDVDFLNCNLNSEVQPINPIEGFNNYYYPQCSGGITNVNSYHSVCVKNIYNNIDVRYYGWALISGSKDKQSESLPGTDNLKKGLKYDIIVNPHADPGLIKLVWKGVERISINSKGNLVIKTSLGEFIESMPKVYQNINGRIVDVKAQYILHENVVSFEFENRNPDYSLIIDPWLSYYGGSEWEVGGSVTTDPSGNVAFAGMTSSLNFPTSPGAFQLTLGGGIANVFDVYVVKMSAAGLRLWATYLGGSSGEGNNNAGTGPGISSDNTGNFFVAGTTNSTNFPVGAIAGNVVYKSISDGADAFLYKFSPTGTRIWGTVYGGTGNDVGYDVATDGTNAFLYGNTSSTTGMSTAGTFQLALSGFNDVFVAMFTPIGNRTWGSYAGGSSGENWGNGGITFDPVTSSIYISGITTSFNFPVTPGCHQSVAGGGFYDAFLFKFSNLGARLWATYYGGSAQEYYTCVNTCDGLGNVFLSGVTTSVNNISSGGSYQPTHGGGTYDGYLAKFNSAGVRQWGTYVGGSASEYIWGIATDAKNNVYIAGDFEDMGPGNYPISSCAYQKTFGGGPINENEDQFIAKYNPGGIQRCVTYLGGNLEDDADNSANTITISGNVLYLTGYTHGNYPVTAGAFQTLFGGGFDSFIDQLCINLCESNALGLNYTANTTNVCNNSSVKFTPSVSNACDTAGYKFHWVFSGGTPATSDSVNPTVFFTTVGTHDVNLYLTTTCKTDSIKKSNYITTTQCSGCNLTGQFIKGTANCADCGCKQWVMISATGGDGPYTYQWPDGYNKRYKNQLCSGNYKINIMDKAGCSVDIYLTMP